MDPSRRRLWLFFHLSLANILLDLSKCHADSLPKPRLAFYTGYVDIFNHEAGRLAGNLFGSEVALLNLAEQLRPYYDITVITQSYNPPLNVDGWLHYLSFEDARKLMAEGIIKPYEVMIVSRYIHYFLYAEARAMAKKTYLWLHDVAPQPYLIGKVLPRDGCPIVANTIDDIAGIIVLTEWHKRHVQAVCQLSPDSLVMSKMMIIGNGIVELVPSESPIERIPHRFIWTSAENRGLPNLVSIFPRIRELLPDAELHVFRGDHDPSMPHDPKSVIFHGNVHNSVIQKEMQKADYWLYPTQFTETFCISALEAQRGGAIAIASNLAALGETVGPRGVLLKQDPYSAEGAEEVLGTLDTIERDPARKETLRSQAQQWANNQTWPFKAQEWLGVFGQAPMSNGECHHVAADPSSRTGVPVDA